MVLKLGGCVLTRILIDTIAAIDNNEPSVLPMLAEAHVALRGGSHVGRARVCIVVDTSSTAPVF